MQIAALEKAIEKKEAVQKFEKENLKNTDYGNEVESNPPNTNPNPGVGAPQDPDMFGGAVDINELIQIAKNKLKIGTYNISSKKIHDTGNWK